MFDVLWSVGGFLVAMGVLVSFHEFGHYWVARRCGVKVLRFSLGFGKVIWQKKAADGVEWTVSALPLGGYVKFLDEREGEVAPSERHLAFNKATVGKRLAIVAAGPLFNFALAIALYWLVYVWGVEGMRTVIAEPPAESAAAAAQLVKGDEIVSVAGRDTPTWTVLRTELLDAAMQGGTLPMQVKAAEGTTRAVNLDLSRVRLDPEKLFDDLGLDAFQPVIPPVLGPVSPEGAAAAAGLLTGDRVLSINDEPMGQWMDLVRWVRAHPGEVAQFEVQRGSETLRLKLIVARAEEGGVAIGRIGAGYANDPAIWDPYRAEYRLDPLSAIGSAISQTWRMSVLTLQMLGKMVIGEVSLKNISGPLSIAQVAGFTAQVGLVSFLSFMAIVSISLGVLNLLPIPILDGGHLVYYTVEAIKGSPVSDKVQDWGARVGMTALMMLMGLAFYNDVIRLIQ